MSRYVHITDELLSAYIDGDVTTNERALVESAAADDPEIAWRLATLQHTVNLLARLPEISLPRSFALTEAMVAKPMTEAAGVTMQAPAVPRKGHAVEKAGFWQGWRSFWQGGNVLMRNAAAASFAAFLVLAVVGPMMSPQNMSESQSADIALLSAPAESALRLDIAASERSAVKDPSPRVAAESRLVESAPAEPIPQPAAAAEEAESVAMAASAPVTEADSAAEEATADNLAVKEVAAIEETFAADGVDRESELITAAAVMMVEEDPNFAEEGAEPDAAPEAMVVSAPAQSVPPAEGQQAEGSNAEILASEPPIAEEPVNDGGDESSAATGAASVAVLETPAEIGPADDHTESDPVVEAEMVPEAAPSGVSESVEQTPRDQEQVVATSSTSTPNNMQSSDPLVFVQIIALSLTLLFASLWLLSRRTQPTPG